jgi:hypothetical protein
MLSRAASIIASLATETALQAALQEQELSRHHVTCLREAETAHQAETRLSFLQVSVYLIWQISGSL